MRTRPRVAFFSYSHKDDELDNGYITALCKRIVAEIEAVTGESLDYFLDVDHLTWGERWQERIAMKAEQTLVLVPIVTPNYLKSEYCRKEYELFMSNSTTHGQVSYIFPIYYLNVAERIKKEDEFAKEIMRSQLLDWREYRLKSLTDPVVVNWIHQHVTVLADRIFHCEPVVVNEPVMIPPQPSAPIVRQRQPISQTATRPLPPKTPPDKPITKPEPPLVQDAIWKYFQVAAGTSGSLVALLVLVSGLNHEKDKIVRIGVAICAALLINIGLAGCKPLSQPGPRSNSNGSLLKVEIGALLMIVGSYYFREASSNIIDTGLPILAGIATLVGAILIEAEIKKEKTN